MNKMKSGGVRAVDGLRIIHILVDARLDRRDRVFR